MHFFLYASSMLGGLGVLWLLVVVEGADASILIDAFRVWDGQKGEGCG